MSTAVIVKVGALKPLAERAIRGRNIGSISGIEMKMGQLKETRFIEEMIPSH